MQTKTWIWLSIGLVVLVLIAIAGLAAVAFGAQGKPIVVINAPVNGSQFNGTVDANSRTMSGTLIEVGALTFTKQ